jgi:hypothetical protein
MNRLVILSLLNAVLSLGACRDDAAEESVAAEQPPAGAQSTEKTQRKTMNEAVKEAAARAIEASKEFEVGDTSCERAYGGLTGFAKSLTKEFGTKKAPRKVDHDGFIELCESLPPEAQQCLIPSYVLEHADQCREVRNEFGPEFRSKLAALSKEDGTKDDGETAEPAPEDAP